MRLHAASNPLKPGEGGSSEFIAGEEGTYYYICTVPGHREQGMVGEIIVGDAQGGDSPRAAAPPTGVSHEFTLDFVESDDFRTLAFNALPGEDGHNPEIRVNSGDEVTVTVTNVVNHFIHLELLQILKILNSVVNGFCSFNRIKCIKSR